MNGTQILTLGLGLEMPCHHPSTSMSRQNVAASTPVLMW